WPPVLDVHRFPCPHGNSVSGTRQFQPETVFFNKAVSEGSEPVVHAEPELVDARLDLPVVGHTIEFRRIKAAFREVGKAVLTLDGDVLRQGVFHAAAGRPAREPARIGSAGPYEFPGDTPPRRIAAVHIRNRIAGGTVDKDVADCIAHAPMHASQPVGTRLAPL